MAANHSVAGEGNKRHKHEGPQKHIIGFIFSIILTIIAFAAVAAGDVNRTFLMVLLVTMAILQVIIQMGFWMHMKDRGHMIPIIFIFGGAFVALTCVIMAVYWVWW